VRSLHRRSRSILFQRLQRASRPLLIFIFLLVFTPTLQAILDTNQNGVSDLWEKKYNQGALFSTFTPTADPDADGWTHAQEALAGTDPFSSNSLTGCVRPTLLNTPAVYLNPAQAGSSATLLTPAAITLTWPTLAGKRYTVLYSSDLSTSSWSPLGTQVTGTGSELGTGVTLTQPDGSTPPKIFLKVAIADQDTDADTLTDAEEAQLGTNALLGDTDSDGLPDAWEISRNLNSLTHDSAQDPDYDGFTNLQEFQNGTNPRVMETSADSDGNGLSDSWELQHFGRIGVNPDGDEDRDGFKNLAEQLGGTDPQGQASYPPGTPLPNGVPQLVGEQLTFSGTRWGSNGFQNPAKKYLKIVYHTVNTDPDDWGFAGDETRTTITNVRTGEQTYFSTGTPTQDWASLEPWIVASDVSSSHSGIHSPWGVNSNTSAKLSDEYTIPTFVANVESWFPAYQNKFTVAVPWVSNNVYTAMFHTITAHISLTPEASDPYPAMSYYITKLKYKWKVNAGQSQVVNWLEVFTPKDGSSVSAEVKSWIPSSTDTESPVYEIDPTTKNGKKNGHYSVLPVDIMAVFGFEWQQTGKDRMDNALAGMVDEPTEFKQIGAETSTFYIKGKAQGANTVEKYWVIQTARSEAAIKSGLASAPYVVFEGHANMGLGPAFNNQPAKISDFTNFGNPQAAINWEYLRTTEYPNFTTMTAAETPSPVANYMVLPQKINIERYDNINGVGIGQNFTLKGTGSGRYHFNRLGDNEVLIVNAGKADLPVLGYKAFFYNSCKTARDFGEVFQHGKFFCSNVSCYADYGASVEFVKGLITGETWTEILFDLNDTHALDDTIVGPAYRLVE
jgi:Bacterial TSP3 repeat